ncbi:mannose-1-phosphate guanylyltransferase/mannose-6-phosphate isomerase [Gilvimarinus sp. 1_MG-2023]|uniref:mannose-1-phosphate guanylyltransferase/mannose-6-phosphate isomerase n=1 Tax=Gilvimarinus sp. 1_MG-2023 TaxID=3062638 RepID=UPI0026E31668|nr:mannose-1-phosphate guanylyltransferase/mannose-6-phosphate isomerase [Gilvimarinus sp. 1_MG-2023]MDO6746302.1 mannose-1-phosphate guanylyltransferase/mannose-6-phosphate isomerase [Gilvimarinus sp. 1_MG-2023]
MIFPVVLSGGSGSRLWPMSRELYPKQFLPLVGENTLLQDTLQRLEGLNPKAPILVCNEEHRFLAAEQLRQIGQLDHNIILEPAGRNTAPAIALAAFTALESDPNAVLLVLPADHVINDPDSFRAVVEKATKAAQQGDLVTFGIVPTYPETGYGYIRGEAGGELGQAVKRFVEKPDLETAKTYLASGDYYWNSGMFLFRADRYLEELNQHRPEIFQACQASFSAPEEDLDFVRVNKEDFLLCPSESVDYAVMENTERAIVFPLDAGWSDVGSWSSMADVEAKDELGNTSKGDVIQHNSRDTYVFAENALVSTVGLDGIVVVQTKDAILVAAKDQVQDVKTVVQSLKASGRDEYRLHRDVYRPWGKYESIDSGDRYQVKRITVKPGEKLSVQMHHHRAEHWIVVSGTAKVTIDKNTTLVTENQSVYIPVGSVHALENPGQISLHLIEVQSGAYLGEDDIVRFEDRYGRN